MTYKVYVNVKGKAVYSGLITAETYEAAMEEATRYGIKAEDVMVFQSCLNWNEVAA